MSPLPPAHLGLDGRPESGEAEHFRATVYALAIWSASTRRFLRKLKVILRLIMSFTTNVVTISRRRMIVELYRSV